jgi:hypothetical protein
MNLSFSHLWKRSLLGAIAALAAALAVPGTAGAGCGDDLTIHRSNDIIASAMPGSLGPGHGSMPRSDQPCGCKGPGCSAVPSSSVPHEPSVPPSPDPERAVLLSLVSPVGPDSSSPRFDESSGKPAHTAQDVYHPPR